MGVPAIGVFWFAELRVAIAAVVMAGYVLCFGVHLNIAKHWRAFLTMGLLNAAVPWVLYAYAISTPAAAAGMTPLECAGAITKSLAARQGTPPPSQVFKARVNERPFVALYAAPLGVGTQLHAHLLSAAGGTHCIEVHATKISNQADDLAAWLTDLEKARIESD